MKSVNKLCVLIINDGRTDKEPNRNGNTVHRMFAPAERYLVDYATNFTVEHWQQYDTDQDAPYFGVWVNPHSLQVLTYAEGDWTLVSCIDAEAFNAEISHMNDFYGEGFICAAFGARGCTVYVQNRDEFTIESGKAVQS